MRVAVRSKAVSFMISGLRLKIAIIRNTLKFFGVGVLNEKNLLLLLQIERECSTNCVNG
jgi:hypothetical protein